MTKWDKWENLTPAAIYQIAWEIRDGEADPKDAKRLLEFFCDCVEDNNAIPKELLKHFAESFRDHLTNSRSIASSLGLERKPGRPKSDEQVQIEMAADILRLRLEGKSHQTALQDVSEKFGWGETRVSDAWKAYSMDAINLLRMERHLDQFPWTPDEIERMSEIFGNKPWFITSENSKTKPK